MGGVGGTADPSHNHWKAVMHKRNHPLLLLLLLYLFDIQVILLGLYISFLSIYLAGQKARIRGGREKRRDGTRVRCCANVEEVASHATMHSQEINPPLLLLPPTRIHIIFLWEAAEDNSDTSLSFVCNFSPDVIIGPCVIIFFPVI